MSVTPNTFSTMCCQSFPFNVRGKYFKKDASGKTERLEDKGEGKENRKQLGDDKSSSEAGEF